MKPAFLIITVIGFQFNLHALTNKDPSADIRVRQLSNGLKVIYAPSPNSDTIQIRIRVQAGRWSEDRAGVAHLLEHYMFKDAKLEKDMTYMEVIKENGGEANAYVDDQTTTFYATVPPAKGKWIVGLFGKMLLNKKFIAADVEAAKKPVYLEIGQPNPLHYLSAFMGTILPELNLFPGFWETEFGYKRPSRQPIPDQITTASLTTADIEKFYRKFYHAQNMTLFLAGNFRVSDLAPSVESSFFPLPQGQDKGVKLSPLKAKIRPFIRSNATSGTPRLEIGTKVSDISREEAMAVSVYLEYLAHVLMKDLRNNRGETYTVIPRLDIRSKNGIASVSMEAPTETYYTNLKLVRDRIESEVRKGEISEKYFAEARDLYAHKFELTDKDSNSMMNLALKTEEYLNDYGDSTKTPYQIFHELNLETYKAHLRSVFASQMRYEKTAEPPLVFRYEEWLLMFLGIVGWARLAKKVYAKPFVHTQLRWVRKINYPPVFLVQVGAMLFALFICSVLLTLLFNYWNQIPIGHNSFLIEDYFIGQAGLALTYFTFQSCFRLFGRKVMIVGPDLWIKSLGYSSTIIPMTKIYEIKLENPLLVLLNPAKMWRVKHRFIYFDLALWRPGVMIELTDGRYYFLGLKNPRFAAKELKAYSTKSAQQTLSAVA